MNTERSRAAERTRMFEEAAEARARCAPQLRYDAAAHAQRSAQRCARSAPRAVMTCARGSSDHAATYARYLIETLRGC